MTGERKALSGYVELFSSLLRSERYAHIKAAKYENCVRVLYTVKKKTKKSFYSFAWILLARYNPEALDWSARLIQAEVWSHVNIHKKWNVLLAVTDVD